MTHPAVAINELPALPREQGGPVFNEPWEAQAFALAVRLSEAGYFSWSEWTAVLSEEIKAAQARGDPDLGHTYYQHWLNALERICVEKDLVGHADMRQRRQEWLRAYRHTAHGHPVELSAAVYVADSRQHAFKEAGPYQLYFRRTLLGHGVGDRAQQQTSGYLTLGAADFIRPEHREAFARSGDFRSHTWRTWSATTA